MLSCYQECRFKFYASSDDGDFVVLKNKIPSKKIYVSPLRNTCIRWEPYARFFVSWIFPADDIVTLQNHDWCTIVYDGIVAMFEFVTTQNQYSGNYDRLVKPIEQREFAQWCKKKLKLSKNSWKMGKMYKKLKLTNSCKKIEDFWKKAVNL